MLDINTLIEFVKGLGYLGAFLSGFLGSSSLFIAIFPSYLVVPILATQLNPVITGILAGVGAGFGQYLHYYVGLGGRAILPKKYKERVEKWKERLGRYGVIVIFAFAATPLSPDDVIWIPLGMMRYPKLKALLAAIAGKVLLNLLYAFAGYYGWEFLTQYLNLP
jgi:membrane protein YqaA with SNARE-associated domain